MRCVRAQTRLWSRKHWISPWKKPATKTWDLSSCGSAGDLQAEDLLRNFSKIIMMRFVIITGQSNFVEHAVADLYPLLREHYFDPSNSGMHYSPSWSAINSESILYLFPLTAWSTDSNNWIRRKMLPESRRSSRYASDNFVSPLWRVFIIHRLFAGQGCFEVQSWLKANDW